MSLLRGLAGASQAHRPRARRMAAWVLTIVGPALVTLAALPFRVSLGLGGVLFCMLLVVIAVAVVGGPWPALAAVVLGILLGEFFFARPYGSLRVDLHPDLISVVAFAIVGPATGILIGNLARLAEEQASSRRVETALRRVATLVARASPAEELFAAVTEEVGRLVGADFARLARYEPSDALTFVAAWSRTGEHFPVGSRWALIGENNVGALVLRTGRSARIDDFAGISGPLAADARERGVRSAAGAPIVVEGRIWGVIFAGSNLKQPLLPDTEARLASVTELVATAIANADSRAGITRLAEEQAALRRVATLVARGAPAEEVFGAVTEEAGQLTSGRPDDDEPLRVRRHGDHRRWVEQDRRRPSHWPAAQARRGKPDDDRLADRRPARIASTAHASGDAIAVIRPTGLRSGVGTPIIVQDRLWGVMIANSTSEQELAPDTEARLASFTDLVATAIANAEHLAQLTASRARVVATADETRRRLERDLHDGAQQRLVSLRLALRAAQTIVPSHLGELGDELEQVADGLEGVLDELREMARGIHPAILAKGGLALALKTLARRWTIPVKLDMRDVARLPERVEVAAYYVISEALTNAAKHAQASLVNVEVETVEGALRLCVRDDGVGGADPIRGSGLIGLKDRVEALGGTITIQSPLGSGTAVRVELPLNG